MLCTPARSESNKKSRMWRNFRKPLQGQSDTECQEYQKLPPASVRAIKHSRCCIIHDVIDVCLLCASQMHAICATYAMYLLWPCEDNTSWIHTRTSRYEYRPEQDVANVHTKHPLQGRPKDSGWKIYTVSARTKNPNKSKNDRMRMTEKERDQESLRWQRIRESPYASALKRAHSKRASHTGQSDNPHSNYASLHVFFVTFSHSAWARDIYTAATVMWMSFTLNRDSYLSHDFELRFRCLRFSIQKCSVWTFQSQRHS